MVGRRVVGQCIIDKYDEMTMTTAKDRTAIIEALVSAKKRINFYEQWRPKGIIYERQDAEALRKIAAALAALGFEGDGDDDH